MSKGFLTVSFPNKLKLLFIMALALFALVLAVPTSVSADHGGFDQCIHITIAAGEPTFACGRGEPDSHGPPPAVYVDGENVTDG